MIKASKETGVIVTAEEHTVMGGLGSAVAEVASQEAPCFIKMFGVNDRFGRSGTPDALLKAYNLTTEDLVKTCKDAVALKR